MYEVFASLLKERNVTAADVSRATGIRTSTLTDWKNGRYTPKADKLQKIADYFGVSLEYLRTGVRPSVYYQDDETAALAQRLLTDPDLRALMDAARDSSPDDMRMVADILRRVKGSNDG